MHIQFTQCLHKIKCMSKCLLFIKCTDKKALRTSSKMYTYCSFRTQKNQNKLIAFYMTCAEFHTQYSLENKQTGVVISKLSKENYNSNKI